MLEERERRIIFNSAEEGPIIITSEGELIRKRNEKLHNVTHTLMHRIYCEISRDRPYKAKFKIVEESDYSLTSETRPFHDILAMLGAEKRAKTFRVYALAIDHDGTKKRYEQAVAAYKSLSDDKTAEKLVSDGVTENNVGWMITMQS